MSDVSALGVAWLYGGLRCRVLPASVGVDVALEQDEGWDEEAR